MHAYALPVVNERRQCTHATGPLSMLVAVPGGAGGLQVSKLLQYAPQKRLTCTQAMTHTFFDELRDPNTRLPNGGCSGQPRVRPGLVHTYVLLCGTPG